MGSLRIAAWTAHSPDTTPFHHAKYTMLVDPSGLMRAARSKRLTSKRNLPNWLTNKKPIFWEPTIKQTRVQPTKISNLALPRVTVMPPLELAHATPVTTAKHVRSRAPTIEFSQRSC